MSASSGISNIGPSRAKRKITSYCLVMWSNVLSRILFCLSFFFLFIFIMANNSESTKYKHGDHFAVSSKNVISTLLSFSHRSDQIYITGLLCTQAIVITVAIDLNCQETCPLLFFCSFVSSILLYLECFWYLLFVFIGKWLDIESKRHRETLDKEWQFSFFTYLYIIVITHNNDSTTLRE